MKLSTVQLEILLGRFSDWALPQMPKENAPVRKGLSAGKYWAGLHQALFGPLTLRQICTETNVSVTPNVLKVWRGEPEFKKVAHEAAQGFAAFMVREVLAEAGYDSLRRLVLTELLVMLPGFDIGRNEIIEKLAEVITRLEDDPTKRPGFQLLHNYLLCYRDVVRLAHHYAKDSNMKSEVEEKVGGAVSHLQERAAALIKIGRENGTLHESLAEAIGAVNLSLTFLAAYSRIVI